MTMCRLGQATLITSSVWKFLPSPETLLNVNLMKADKLIDNANLVLGSKSLIELD